MLFPINTINKILFQVKGYSGLLLKVEVLKKILITIVLFVSAPFGVIIMCYGIVLTSIISIGVNTYYTSKLLDVSFFAQIKDIIPIFFISLISALIVLSCSVFFESSSIQLKINSSPKEVKFEEEEFVEAGFFIISNGKLFALTSFVSRHISK